jgi:hypothetical protein
MYPSFSAPTLCGAMAAATGRNHARCERLRADIGALGERAGRLARELETLRREIESYRGMRDGARFDAVVLAVGAVASAVAPVVSISRGLIAIARSRGAISFVGIASMAPVVGSVVAVRQALNALETATRNDSLIRGAMRTAAAVESEARAIEQDLRILEGHSTAYGCNSDAV